MADASKTVFISYRRNVASFIARAVFMDLRLNGYDVFMDVENIDSGLFGTVILKQIAARVHFVVILTPGTVERCLEPEDWLRREIEYAIDLKRNIVPLLVNNFVFIGTEKYLTGKLQELQFYNGLNVPHDYFDEAMVRLRVRYLKQSVNVDNVTMTPIERKEAQERIAEMVNLPTPTKEELNAEDYFNRGFARSDNSDDEIAYYSQAIQLNPQYSEAYYNRGVVHFNRNQLDMAIADYTKAVELKPEYAEAYNYRGIAYRAKGTLEAAITDYNLAIKFNPHYAKAYNNRGIARSMMGDFNGAIADFTTAIQYDSGYAGAYNNRGIARKGKGDLDAAVSDYEKAIRLNPNFADAYNNRGIVLRAKGQIEKAIIDYNRAIRVNPNFIAAYYNRAQAYEAKNDLSHAIADYQKFLALGGGKQYNNHKQIENWIAELTKKPKH
jgi:tetratricopeptide (TPR) repeat protein